MAASFEEVIGCVLTTKHTFVTWETFSFFERSMAPQHSARCRNRNTRRSTSLHVRCYRVRAVGFLMLFLNLSEFYLSRDIEQWSDKGFCTKANLPRGHEERELPVRVRGSPNEAHIDKGLDF